MELGEQVWDDNVPNVCSGQRRFWPDHLVNIYKVTYYCYYLFRYALVDSIHE